MPVHGDGLQVTLESHTGLWAQRSHRAAPQVEELNQKDFFMAIIHI